MSEWVSRNVCQFNRGWCHLKPEFAFEWRGLLLGQFPKDVTRILFWGTTNQGTSTCHSLRSRLANSFWLPTRSCKLLRIPGNGLANWFPLSLNACTWCFVLFSTSCIPLLNRKHFIFPISFSAPLIILINWNSTATCFACMSYVIPYVDLFLYPATN